jgi:hypothetical protein
LQEVCVLLEPWYWSHDQRFWWDPPFWNQTLDYVKSSFTHTLHSYWVDAHRNSSKLYNKQTLKCGCGGDGCSNFWSMGVFLCVYTLCVSLWFFLQKKWVGSHTSTSFKVFDTILMVFVKRFWACLVVSSCFCCSNVLSRFDFLISIQQTIWLHCSHIYVQSIK